MSKPTCGSCRHFDKAAWPDNKRFGKCIYPVPLLLSDEYVDCKVRSRRDDEECTDGFGNTHRHHEPGVFDPQFCKRCGAPILEE